MQEMNEIEKDPVQKVYTLGYLRLDSKIKSNYQYVLNLKGKTMYTNTKEFYIKTPQELTYYVEKFSKIIEELCTNPRF